MTTRHIQALSTVYASGHSSKSALGSGPSDLLAVVNPPLFLGLLPTPSQQDGNGSRCQLDVLCRSSGDSPDSICMYTASNAYTPSALELLKDYTCNELMTTMADVDSEDNIQSGSRDELINLNSDFPSDSSPFLPHTTESTPCEAIGSLEDSAPAIQIAAEASADTTSHAKLPGTQLAAADGVEDSAEFSWHHATRAQCLMGNDGGDNMLGCMGSNPFNLDMQLPGTSAPTGAPAPSFWGRLIQPEEACAAAASAATHKSGGVVGGSGCNGGQMHDPSTSAWFEFDTGHGGGTRTRFDTSMCHALFPLGPNTAVGMPSGPPSSVMNMYRKGASRTGQWNHVACMTQSGMLFGWDPSTDDEVVAFAWCGSRSGHGSLDQGFQDVVHMPCVSVALGVGRGGFGHVFLAYSLHNNGKLAVKVVSSTNSHHLVNVHKEARVGMELRHPNLVATWGFITVPPGHHVLPEFYGGLSTPNTALAKAAAWPIPSQGVTGPPLVRKMTGWLDTPSDQSLADFVELGKSPTVCPSHKLPSPGAPPPNAQGVAPPVASITGIRVEVQCETPSLWLACPLPGTPPSLPQPSHTPFGATPTPALACTPSFTPMFTPGFTPGGFTHGASGPGSEACPTPASGSKKAEWGDEFGRDDGAKEQVCDAFHHANLAVCGSPCQLRQGCGPLGKALEGSFSPQPACAAMCAPVAGGTGVMFKSPQDFGGPGASGGTGTGNSFSEVDSFCEGFTHGHFMLPDMLTHGRQSQKLDVHTCIYQEFASHGSLCDRMRHVLNASGGGPTDVIATLLAHAVPLLEGAAQGLAYMHAHGYIHGDIKAQNVLVGSDPPHKPTRVPTVPAPPAGRRGSMCLRAGWPSVGPSDSQMDVEAAEQLVVRHLQEQAAREQELSSPGSVTAKLCDFGLAVKLPEGQEQVAGLGGTPTHLAPETAAHANPPVSTATDVYAFGITMWEAVELHGSSAYPGVPPAAIPTYVLTTGARPQWKTLQRAADMLAQRQKRQRQQAACQGGKGEEEEGGGQERGDDCEGDGEGEVLSSACMLSMTMKQLVQLHVDSDDVADADNGGEGDGDEGCVDLEQLVMLCSAYRALAEQCWAPNPAHRPPMAQVVQQLQGLGQSAADLRANASASDVVPMLSF